MILNLHLSKNYCLGKYFNISCIIYLIIAAMFTTGSPIKIIYNVYMP